MKGGRREEGVRTVEKIGLAPWAGSVLTSLNDETLQGHLRCGKRGRDRDLISVTFDRTGYSRHEVNEADRR